LLVGLKGAGKTHLLYNAIIGEDNTWKQEYIDNDDNNRLRKEID